MNVIGVHALPFKLPRKLEWNEDGLDVGFRPSTYAATLNIDSSFTGSISQYNQQQEYPTCDLCEY
jgi:hypothetical protein